MTIYRNIFFFTLGIDFSLTFHSLATCYYSNNDDGDKMIEMTSDTDDS